MNAIIIVHVILTAEAIFRHALHQCASMVVNSIYHMSGCGTISHAMNLTPKSWMDISGRQSLVASPGIFSYYQWRGAKLSGVVSVIS